MKRYKLITDWVLVKIHTSDDECNWNPPSYRRLSCHPLFPDHSDQPREFVTLPSLSAFNWWAPMNSIRKCFTSVLPLSAYRPITPITILQLTYSHHYFHQKIEMCPTDIRRNSSDMKTLLSGQLPVSQRWLWWSWLTLVTTIKVSQSSNAINHF